MGAFSARPRFPQHVRPHSRLARCARTGHGCVLPPHRQDRQYPPFIGQSMHSEEQTDDLHLVWGDGYDGYLDYVTVVHQGLPITSDAVPAGQSFRLRLHELDRTGRTVASLFRPSSKRLEDPDSPADLRVDVRGARRCRRSTASSRDSTGSTAREGTSIALHVSVSQSTASRPRRPSTPTWSRAG